jgi:D-alanine transaminase
MVVTPVIRIDGQNIGDGRAGPVALALRGKFHEAAEIAP